ncbi:hypothetical protein CY34DRAFT_813857 [Suillus luteus UH-Slu-Lm8-n1]|uniref:Protein kinase domain-containing protein n=1 Tax=Suillus luteus UH-Slu-Lm8-n1 TaxID=930992 RepID=A0A0D0A4B7_9AGAM|nr:hypothetical protein CY34DRAFT_813857 [Suillus luteus UH-Slu-Lm8-n1]
MPPKSTQPLPSENDMRSEPKDVQSGRGSRTMTASVVNLNTLTPSDSGSQLERGSSLGKTVTTAARSDTVHDVHSTSSQQDAVGDIIDPERISQSSDDDSQASIFEPPSPPILPLAEDLTGQIFGTINPYVASGTLGNVYRCEWRRPSGTVKVAVKAFRNPTNLASEQDRRRFRRETAVWAHLVHDNIVTLYGMTEGFGPSIALVSQWFPDGTLFRLITERGTTLTIKSKLKLLHGIASGLYYLHAFPMVHGDITSANVMVDLKDGEYRACLTDLGLSNVICGHLNDRPIEGSTFWPGAVRWTAPELLKPHDPTLDFKLTTQNDMYSFGRVMFHLLTLVVPWYGIDEYTVVQKIIQGEVIPRPEISDVTHARWNHIEQCWSIHPSIRPSAFEAMGFLKHEQEALKQDDVIVGGAQGSHQNAHLVVEQAGVSTTISAQSSPRTLVPSRKLIPSSLLTQRLFSTVSSLLLSSHLNVLLFGETGVGKSAIINLIMGRDVAQMSPDAASYILQHTPDEVNLGDRSFKLWEVSSIESMDFFRASFTKRLLKKSYKKLYEDDGVYLLLDQRALIRDYKFFTDVVGSSVAGGVPVAAVVTNLEDYPKDMDGWWTKNKDNLESLGMRFTAHACITSMPDDPNASLARRARRHRSEQVIRTLIHNSYQAGAETPRSSSPALTV